MKRAQMTVTLILAILILAIFAFVFYLTSSTVESKIEQAQQKQQAGSEALQPVTDYVSQCLDTVGQEAITLIGLQGGHIYQSQGGISPDPTPNTAATYESYDVMYGIKAPVGNVGGFFVAGDYEKYPWPEFPTIVDGSEYFKGYYGLNVLPTLEGTQSIEESLESYVAAQMLTCVDWDVFASRGVEVDAGEPHVDIVFAQNDVKFLMEYPMNVSIQGAGVDASLSTFSSTFPVRLRNIINFTHAVADLDAGDIAYEIAGQTSTQHPEIMAIIQAQYPDYDIIRIIDPLSRFAARDFVFQFARRNRQPALFYLEADDSLCPDGEVNLDNEDILLDGCATPEILPVLYLDPDEDNVTIHATSGTGLPTPFATPFERDAVVDITITDEEGLYDRQIVVLPYDPLGGAP